MVRILCLESGWGLKGAQRLTDQRSMLPLIEFLKTQFVANRVSFSYRTLTTKSDMEYYMKLMGQSTFADYVIIYIACHGKNGKFILGDGTTMSLEELGEICKELRINLEDKIIHFGSCKTFNVSEKRLQAFKDASGAQIVSGYTKKVDFLASSLLDIAYFEALISGKRTPDKVSKTLSKYYCNLIDNLQFKMI